MVVNLDYEVVKSIYINILMVLTVFLTGMVAYRFSILSKMRDRKLMEKQAFTDPLTGGGNRQLFLKVIEELIVRGQKFALCFLDLDGFKQINDTLGHDAGDELLKQLYIILSKQLENKNGNVYRLGGDEFAIILTNVDTTEDIAKILDKVKEEFKKPIIIENTNILLEYSLGVSIFPTDADNKKDLLAYADDAMYYIKEHGKSNYYFHNKVLKAKQDNKTKMENDLKSAYANNQFGVALQQRIDLKDTSKICFEALIYWQHPILGYLKAEYFIKQAEELGLIIKLDEFVLKRSCEKIKELNSKGYKNVQIAVNVSNRHSKRKDFIDNLCYILDEYSLDAGSIQLEFTDIIKPIEIERYKLMLDRLKKCGANIAITNLEIEFESLSMLIGLPIDEIKFNVKYINKDSKFNVNVLDDIIKLGRDLKYSVIVTHIEMLDELKYVCAKDVNKIQGHYIFERITLDDIEKSVTYYEKNVNTIVKALFNS